MAKDNTKTARRRKLFKRFAENLRNFRPQYGGDVFACPICLGLFRETAVESPELALSIAHFWPIHSGVTLACKKCNNDLGGLADKEVSRAKAEWDALGGQKPGATLRAMLKVNEFELPVDFSIDGETINMRQFGGNGNAVTNAITVMKSGKPFKHSLTYQTVRQHRHNVAKLHGAYLVAFHYFGYSYVFDADTQWIRDILTARPLPEDCECFNLMIEKDALPANFRDFACTAMYMTAATGEHCLAVPLPNQNPENPLFFVLMPGFGVAGKEQYAKLRQRQGPQDMRFETIHDLGLRERLQKWVELVGS